MMPAVFSETPTKPTSFSETPVHSFLLFLILLGRHSEILLSPVSILSTQRLPQAFPAFFFTLTSTELFQPAKTPIDISQAPSHLQSFLDPSQLLVQKYCTAEQETGSVQLDHYQALNSDMLECKTWIQ